MSSTLTRPRMGSRAISDMQPLINPSNIASDKSNKDLGIGTQAISGGARVVSGGRTALGGIAPMSPFLPLPPAPEQEEVEKQQEELRQSNFLSVHVSHANVHLRSSSGSNVEGESNITTAFPKHRPAPMMIRSYSMPVATQSDYEAQREAIKRRHQWAQSKNATQTNTIDQAWEATWVQDKQITHRPLHHTSSMRINSKSGNNAMQPSASTMGSAANNKHYLTQTLQHISSNRKKSSPRIQPRSPLSIITLNDLPPCTPENSIEMDLGSGSDEADVITPRASSPHEDYFSKSIKIDTVNSSPQDALAGFIHPDHLQPPPAFGF